MRYLAVAVLAVSISIVARAGEEKIRGTLEKTTKPDACGQIADALNEVYYVTKSDAAEKMIAEFVGKKQKVVLTGTIETKPNETASFINLKTVEPYAPKMPPAPPPPPPPVSDKKDEKKEDVKKDDAKKDDAKKPEEKK